MESEQRSKSLSNIRTRPATPTDEGDLSTFSGKKQGVSSSSSPSSSSFSSSSSRDPWEDSMSTTGSAPFASNSGPETQSPPVQVMERPDESDSPYRIPDSVFTISKSASPMEWSVTSNESLFSIHMGNMSFTRDHLLLGKSGELGMFKSGELVMPGEATTSGQMMNFSSNQNAANLDQGIVKAEAAAAETMREVIRENEVDRSKEKLPLANGSPQSPAISHVSDESGGASVKSFAFPILTAEGSSHKKGSLKVSPDEQQKQQEQQPLTPAANTTAWPGWLSCFSCCPFCS